MQAEGSGSQSGMVGAKAKEKEEKNWKSFSVRPSGQTANPWLINLQVIQKREESHTSASLLKGLSLRRPLLPELFLILTPSSVPVTSAKIAALRRGLLNINYY